MLTILVQKVGTLRKYMRGELETSETKIECAGCW